MPILTEAEVAVALQRLPQWTIVQRKLTREWTFSTFAEAMRFVVRVAELAETQNHHPDMDIRYDRVRLSLISYDVGGLTQRDIRLAERIVGDAQ